MKKTFFSVVTISLAVAVAPTSLGASISYDAQSFLIDGRRTVVFSGELHYWRIPEAEWSERVTRIKAAGINTISTPIPWAWHEKKPGEIDLSDFERFLGICESHGLYVVARIGPVTGADLEFRGLPLWLIAMDVPGMDTDSELYLRYAARWYNAVCPLVARHQITNGGAIILVQIDDEYESTIGNPSSADPAHLRTIARAARERGIDVPLFINYSLWPPADIPNVLTALDIFPGWNLDALESALTRHRQKWPDRPLSIAEFGLFEDYATIGAPQPRPPRDLPAAYRANVVTMLSEGASFINHYTISGMWSFAYEHRRDISNICYPHAPVTVSGGLNETYGPVRLTGLWLDSFGSDFRNAREVGPEIVEVIHAESGDTAQNASPVQLRAFLSDDALYIFLHEQQGRPAAFSLRMNNPASGQSLTFPAESHIPLARLQSKILMAGVLRDPDLYYSTSEISARGDLGEIDYLIFHGDSGTPGEIALATARQPTSISKSVRLTRDGSLLRLNYIHSRDDQFVRFDNALLVITTTHRAARTWHIACPSARAELGPGVGAETEDGGIAPRTARGNGRRDALLVTDAEVATGLQPTADGIGTTLLCKSGSAYVSSFFSEPPKRVLLDNKKARLSVTAGIPQFTIRTPSGPSVRLRLRRGKRASESSLSERRAPFVRIPDLSRLARSGFYNPGFVRLRTTVPKNAIKSITVRSNATPPLALCVNESPVSGNTQNNGAWTFDLRDELRNDRNQVHLTLEFETVPELEITTIPETILEWEASPGLKGEWLLLFARPDGPEWQRSRLPENPAAHDITWFALPFTLHPKPAWEQALNLRIEAGDEAFVWINGRRFVRHTSRAPETSFPIPSSWLVDGQNLVVTAVRGDRPVTAEIISDETSSLMHHELEIEW